MRPVSHLQTIDWPFGRSSRPLPIGQRYHVAPRQQVLRNLQVFSCGSEVLSCSCRAKNVLCGGGLVLRASRKHFLSGDGDGARMTRSAALWLSALVISASAGAASAADQAIIRKAAVAPEATEYGNLYYGFDWNSHRSLVGYMGVLYAPFGGMDKSGLPVSALRLT